MKIRFRSPSSQILDSEALDLICNPINHERLELRPSKKGPLLVGTKSGDVFHVSNGIPILMDPSHLTDSKRKSQIFYDILAPFYEFSQWIYYSLNGGEGTARNEYLRFIDVKQGDRVLEVSIGNGINIKFLPRNARYFGIDVSLGQLKQCRRNTSKLNLSTKIFQADADQLPFFDNTFDSVFNIGSINYFENKKQAIMEMIRVANPGGLILMADETERFAKNHDRYPIYRGFFGSRTRKVGPPIDELPGGITDVELREIRKGAYFCLRFRKSE